MFSAWQAVDAAARVSVAGETVLVPIPDEFFADFWQMARVKKIKFTYPWDSAIGVFKIKNNSPDNDIRKRRTGVLYHPRLSPLIWA